MNGYELTMQQLMAQSRRAPQEGDYLDEEGYLCCGKCHKRKEYDLKIEMDGELQGIHRVGVTCDCEKAERARFELDQRRMEFQRRLKALYGHDLIDATHRKHTFAEDDGKNAQETELCRRYVQNWDEMRAKNMGLLLYGGVGTGKSFLAHCIANELRSQLVLVGVCSVPNIVQALQGEDRDTVLDRLDRFELLVLDDLGAERDTPYAQEQVYAVVESRCREKRPVIVTSNLSREELTGTTDPQQRRIYDRVIEMCPLQLYMDGESRRKAISRQRTEAAREILGYKEGDEK